MSLASRLTGALLALALAGACQQSPPRPFLSDPPVSGARIRWPPPPGEPRVAYLAEISGEDTFRAPPSRLRRALDWITGRTSEHFVRPSAIAVRGSVLVVADPGRGAVHRLDLTARTWSTYDRTSEGRLVTPVGVLLLPDGRLLVSDSASDAIWAWDPLGEPLGRFTSEQLSRPTGLAFDEQAERVWVVETLEHRLRAFDLSGKELARIGARGTGAGEFNYPVRVSSDGAGGVWVTDSLNFRLQHVSADGHVDRTFGVAGSRAGAFARPRGLAVDRAGRILVVDALFDAVQIFDPDGRLLLVFGDRGADSGEFWLPDDVQLDRANRIFVVDSYNQRVQVFSYHPPGPEA